MAKGDQNRRTPPWLFEEIQLYVGKKFKLDVAASKENALCRRYYDIVKNGLLQPWNDDAFCNHPFKQTKVWIKRAYEQALEHSVTVAVVGPTGCSQSWFHEYARRGRVLVPDQRIVFFDSVTGEPTHGADRDTMIYLFGPGFWNKKASSGVFDMRTWPINGKVITSRSSE